MKLYYYKGTGRNFGDELNHWLWPRLIGDSFRHAPNAQFVGIGTLLDSSLPKDEYKIIFGTGAGYGKPLNQLDPSTHVYFVRGPRTASQLGLETTAGITDSAILAAPFKDALKCGKNSPRSICFMPHHSVVDDCDWGSICENSGIRFVSPREPVEEVLKTIANAKLVVAGAMHAAIAADTFRVPWIPVKTHPGILTFKWQDWCESLEIAYRPHKLGLPWKAGSGILQRTKSAIKRGYIMRQLSRIAKITPLLSDNRVFIDRLHRADEKLDILLRDLEAGKHRRNHPPNSKSNSNAARHSRCSSL